MTVLAQLRRLTPLLVMAAIYYSSSQSGIGPAPIAGVTPTPDWLHNLLHVPAYALLAASWCLALSLRPGWRSGVLIFALTVGYGALDEWHQSFIPGRECSATDLLRDAIGAGMGLWLGGRILWRQRQPAAVTRTPGE